MTALTPTALTPTALTPPDPSLDHFAVLGLTPGFELDLGEAERLYKGLSRKVHPDRFVRAAAPEERRAALAWTVRINDAWRVLKDPVRRAEYLLSLAGIEVAGERGTRKDGTQQPVPQELLMEVMELRMALGEAHEAGDHATVAHMADDVRARADRAMEDVRAGFAATPPDLDRVTQALVALRYWRRFLEEVAVQAAAREDASATEAQGGGTRGDSDPAATAAGNTAEQDGAS